MVQIKIKESDGIFLAVVILLLMFFAESGFASQSASNSNQSIVIWASGDWNYTLGNGLFGDQKTSLNWYNFYFYANYTNSSNSVINASNGNGNCSIRFNETNDYGVFNQLNYNVSLSLWQINESFNYKGNLSYKINCTSSYGNFSLTDFFVVRNSPPRSLADPLSFSASEDSVSIYDFSKNATDDDLNDLPLNYSIENISSNTYPLQTQASFYTWITINSSGMIFANATINSQNGTFNIWVKASDSGDIGGLPEYTTKKVDLTLSATNDPPSFINLENQTMNMSTLTEPYLFYYNVNVTDEENNTPFRINISFMNCYAALWSSRNCSNSSGRELFNSSQYSFNANTGELIINFSPSRNDVGNYTINFTVTDLNNNVAPYNASTSKIVNFFVLSKNTAPTVTYACNNELNWTEGNRVFCYINATDLEEIVNLTYIANYSWFLFNGTGMNWTQGIVVTTANASQNFSSYAVVNFTANDYAVGNISVGLNVIDTGSYGDSSKNIFYSINFSIANVNDVPIFFSVSNQTTFITNSLTFYVNASDDDLLIQDKSSYNEILTFSSNLSWVNITSMGVIAGTNITAARVTITPNSSLIGNFSVLLNVSDMNNASNYTIFNFQTFYNRVPEWLNLSHNISLNENNNFYFNLTAEVNHSDVEQVLTFSFTSDNSFPSFALNSTTGIINITFSDADVGQHILVVNVSDGIAENSTIFNVTISNVDDLPIITAVEAGANITVNGWNMNTTSEINVSFYLYAEDDDFKIPAVFKSYYNETLSINTTILKNGALSSLFSFIYHDFFSPNRTRYIGYFLANSSQAGNYSILVNLTDRAGNSTWVSFNLTIAATLYPPVISPIGDKSYVVNDRLYIDVNASDLEDGSEFYGSNNTNFSYGIINITGNNFLAINKTTGIIENLSGAINFTLTQAHAGFWSYNISVNDSSGLNNSLLLNLYIYDSPNIILPVGGSNFSLVENVSAVFTVNANHSVASNLNYYIYLNGVLKNQTTNYGNGTNFSFSFSPNFTEETSACGSPSRVMAINASNGWLSSFSSWNVTINHTNSPLILSSNIGGASSIVSGTGSASVTLSDYFSDIDALDTCHKQNISFRYIFRNTSATSISVSLSNWTSGRIPNITFTSSEDASVNCTIFAYEYNETNAAQIISNITSNNFTVQISKATSTTSTTTSSSSGGGGASASTEQKIVLLKLVLPGPISVDQKEKIVLPITLKNDGQVNLAGITLFSSIAKNGSFIPGVNSSFDINSFESLKIGESQSVNLTIWANTEESGLYEITINASVARPVYMDWGKIYLNVRNESSIENKFIFIDELIVENPECAEVKEMVELARISYEKKDFQDADEKLDLAINACKKAIEQKPNAVKKTSFLERIFDFVSIATIIFFVIGISYYIYRRRQLRLEGMI